MQELHCRLENITLQNVAIVFRYTYYLPLLCFGKHAIMFWYLASMLNEIYLVNENVQVKREHGHHLLYCSINEASEYM